MQDSFFNFETFGQWHMSCFDTFILTVEEQNRSNIMKSLSYSLALTGLLTIAYAPSVKADTAGMFGPISGLYNTGVDNSGSALLAGSTDLHYTITQNPHPTASSTAVVFGGWPLGENGGPYALNNAGSKWIRSSDDTLSGVADVTGFYTYRLSFTVAQNANLSTLSISGLWSTDNNGTDIRINGNSLGFTTAFEDFHTLHPFNVNSGFVLGANTLDFSFYDGGVTGALRVDQLNADGAWEEFPALSPVPEPATVIGALGLMAPLGWRMLRRKKAVQNKSV